MASSGHPFPLAGETRVGGGGRVGGKRPNPDSKQGEDRPWAEKRQNQARNRSKTRKGIRLVQYATLGVNNFRFERKRKTRMWPFVNSPSISISVFGIGGLFYRYQRPLSELRYVLVPYSQWWGNKRWADIRGLLHIVFALTAG